MSLDIQKTALAEFIGTFMLVLVGAGAVILTGADIVAVALAHGLILMVATATYGHISGGHFNPAISLATWISGHLETRKLGFYVLAQFLGGIAAAMVLWVVIPEGHAGRNLLGQTVPANGVNELDIILVEGLLTFFLASTVFQTAIYGKAGTSAPLYIGLTLGAAILLGGTLTGGSLNPARTFGPWLLASDKDTLGIGNLLVYLLAIFGGAALAAFVHMDTFEPSDVDSPDAPSVRKLRRKRQ